MRSLAFAAALLLAGCNMHLLLQSYTVDWPQASNDVRAWGDRVMARAGHTWQRRATLDVDPARYGQPRAAALRAALTAAGAMLARVGLAARLSHYPRQLSGGEQQRVALARASVGHPAVLFADEPTGNLDTVTGERIAQLLFELNRGSDTTLVLVTHDRTLAARCGRTLTMEAGTMEAGTLHAGALNGDTAPAAGTP